MCIFIFIILIYFQNSSAEKFSSAERAPLFVHLANGRDGMCYGGRQVCENHDPPPVGKQGPANVTEAWVLRSRRIGDEVYSVDVQVVVYPVPVWIIRVDGACAGL